jgi:hypothetical protein
MREECKDCSHLKNAPTVQHCYSEIKLTPAEFPYLLQNFFPLMISWLKERGK